MLTSEVLLVKGISDFTGSRRGYWASDDALFSAGMYLRRHMRPIDPRPR